MSWWEDGRCAALTVQRVRVLQLFSRLSSGGGLKKSMTARGSIGGLVAREIALELGDSSFSPQILDHVPGVANKLADTLSRKYQPGVKYKTPQVLQGVEEVTPPVRDKAYYITLSRDAD